MSGKPNFRNRTCKLCTKQENCYALFSIMNVLNNDYRFALSPDKDDLLLEFGRLCREHAFIPGQES